MKLTAVNIGIYGFLLLMFLLILLIFLVSLYYYYVLIGNNTTDINTTSFQAMGILNILGMGSILICICIIIYEIFRDATTVNSEIIMENEQRKTEEKRKSKKHIKKQLSFETLNNISNEKEENKDLIDTNSDVSYEKTKKKSYVPSYNDYVFTD